VDLHTVTRWVEPGSRADLPTGDPGVAVVAGGTWLFSAPQPHLTTLVDLTVLGWEPLVARMGGLEIAATCTVRELRGARALGDWPALSLVEPCCAAFASAPKIWDLATVGGNVCVALPAGPMISLLSALDATALVWSADGSDRRTPVADLVVGPSRSALAPGDVVRSFHVPAERLHAPVAFRRIALTDEGRSGAVVVARRDPDASVTVSVTAATSRPRTLVLEGSPSTHELDAALARIDDWYDDHHGSAAWRRSMVTTLARDAVADVVAA